MYNHASFIPRILNIRIPYISKYKNQSNNLILNCTITSD